MDKEAIKKMINDAMGEIVRDEIKRQFSGGLFTTRKTTDTPPDSLSMVNRRYVTLNGATAGRPTASVTGQYYFDTTIGRPVYWQGTKWVDGSGTVS